MGERMALMGGIWEDRDKGMIERLGSKGLDQLKLRIVWGWMK